VHIKNLFEFCWKEKCQGETLIGLLNTLQAQQGVLEQKVSRGNLHPFKERKGQRHFEVKAIDKLIGDSTIACEDPARSCRGQETPLEGSEFEELRKDSALVHRVKIE
jgi:hypothetical protein